MSILSMNIFNLKIFCARTFKELYIQEGLLE